MKHFFSKGKNTNLFQEIVNISTIVALILQCVTVPDPWNKFIPWIAYIVIFLSFIGIFLNIKNKKSTKWSRNKLIKKTKKLMTNSTGTTVMFGGDLSWATDYIDVIKNLSINNQTVEIFFPLEKMENATKEAKDTFENRIKSLETAGAKVYALKKDYSLRCTFIGLHPEHENDDFIVISSKRISKDLNNPNRNKYKTILLESSNIEDKVASAAFYLNYLILKENAPIYVR